MQSDQTIDLHAMAIQLLHAKEQETMRLLQQAQDQNQILWLLTQQQQTLIAQQQQTIRQLKVELLACRSAEQSAFGRVHTN